VYKAIIEPFREIIPKSERLEINRPDRNYSLNAESFVLENSLQQEIKNYKLLSLFFNIELKN